MEFKSSCYTSVYVAVCLLSVFHQGVAFRGSALGDQFPRYLRLTYDDLNRTVLGGNVESRLYYEIYSLNDQDPDMVPQLPLLRKTVIRWNIRGDSYSNNYAGYLPATSTCITNEIFFGHVRGKYMEFLLNSDFPEPIAHRGTTYSSDPSRYFINWYCPLEYLVKSNGRERCVRDLRMNIYSPDGPNTLPWHMIADDLCKNNSPPMDDPRWVMTYDSPTQCTFEGSRKRRDVHIEFKRRK